MTKPVDPPSVNANVTSLNSNAQLNALRQAIDEMHEEVKTSKDVLKNIQNRQIVIQKELINTGIDIKPAIWIYSAALLFFVLTIIFIVWN